MMLNKKINTGMTGFETFYNKISDALKGTESGKEMVIRTTYSGIAKTLGLHDFSKSDDYHLVLGILLLVLLLHFLFPYESPSYYLLYYIIRHFSIQIL